MPRFAAFDIGTNNVLMAIAERRDDGRLVAVAERAEITRLGEGVDRTGKLSDAAMSRTVDAISWFAAEARAMGVTEFVAGATSAARDATNGRELIAQVRVRAGVELEILAGDVEARLSFRAVQEDFGALGDPLVAIDIGGGSTEIVTGSPRAGAAPSFRVSLDVGSVRLTERCVTAHPIPVEQERALRACVEEALRDVPAPGAGAVAVAIAATATSLYAVQRGIPRVLHPHPGPLPEGEGEMRLALREGEGELHRDVLAELVSRLARRSLEELRSLPGLDPKRADVICAGGFILLGALERLGLDSCRVSDRGVRWGLLHERFGREMAQS